MLAFVLHVLSNFAHTAKMYEYIKNEYINEYIKNGSYEYP